MYNLLKPAGKAFLTMLFLLGLLTFFGCSESSNDPDSNLPLTGPQSVQVVAGEYQLTLNWTAVAPAQGVEPFYIVYYGLTNDFADAERSDAVPARVGTSELIQVTVTGLQNETEYFVWVETVFGSLGKAALTPVASGMPIPPAATPTDIAVSPGDGLLLVGWTPSPRAASYTVAYSATPTGGTNPPTGAARTTVYTNAALLTGLSNGTTYYLWVMSSNSAADSRYSAEFSGVPAAASAAPDTPAIKTVEERNKRLTVIWDALVSATSYQLHWSDGVSAHSVPVTPEAAEVSYTITGLENGIVYNIHIVAVNAMGSSADSSAVNSVPFAKPPLDYNNRDFVIATATAEFINAQSAPPSPLLPNGLNNKDRLARVKETALGNLFTDGLAWYVRDRYPEENLDFAFINGGYMDGSGFPQGEVTLGRALAVVRGEPAANKLTIISLYGSDVKALYAHAATMSHSLSSTGGGTGGWGNSSKEIRYQITYPVVDMSIPGPNWDEAAGKYKTPVDYQQYQRGALEPGSLKFNGADIDDNRIYRIATPNYIANGGDGYVVFVLKGFNRRDFDLRVYYGVAEYIYDQGTITPYLDGRLLIYGGVPMGGQEPHPPYRN
jgi:hypothetical protein